MDSDQHAVIEAYLQQQPVTRLWEDMHLNTIYHYNKAGVIPFVRKDGFLYFFMKPRSTSPELGEAPFQLCKGTRQYKNPEGNWQDIRDEAAQNAETKETLLATALREGIEELGLKLDNIAQILDMGAFTFSSATTGKTKYMWLFAAEMHDQGDFLPDSLTADSTEARKWLNQPDFNLVGRKDHLYIVRDIETRLSKHFTE